MQIFLLKKPLESETLKILKHAQHDQSKSMQVETTG